MLISLDTVVISNFKSFSGRITINSIQPFTAIIGPNGSGKSNIMDAISFALGEKPSALRVKCLRELIYGGFTAGQSRMKDSTYVKVVFKINDEREKSFTRKIYGEFSQYEIDNKIVTNELYMNELREMGLDIHTGSFLIPQSYIECFAMKTPKDLTTLFEVISNSNTYKADYERLKLELSKAEEEVYFQYQMKKQILIQKKFAAMEKAETEKYLQLKEEYNKEKLKFQLIQLLLIKKKAESLQDEKKEIKLQVDKYLHNKINKIPLLNQRKLEFKFLSRSLENIEPNILELENIIQQKKTEHIIIEENISYWKKKHENARISLNNANKARDTNKRNIQELEDNLNRIDKELTKFRTEETIELNNSQVKRYMELTNKAECQAKDLVKKITSLMRDQQENNDKLDNENRRKQELEDKIKQLKLTEENLKMRLKTLKDSKEKLKTTLNEKTAKVQELSQKITETTNKSRNLENDIAKISETLSQADIDNNTISQQIKKKETIKILKQLYSGVYGRISDLCKPIHSRYDVAITKVFGKNMDAIVVDTKYTATQCIQYLKEQKIGIEIFLPLDSIKKISLKEQLRTIKEPKNVKLLYDVLNISLKQVDKAILFVTKNTLVCETIEDARIIAHHPDKEKAKDCVSLDGCFYRKSGTLSGGQTDLIVKAKQWREQEIVKLQQRKVQLMQEFRNLPKISVMQSELDIINIQIEKLILQNKYIKLDIKNTNNEINKIREELDILGGEILVLNMAISEIQDNIQKQVRKITEIEKHVDIIKNEIFVDFCKAIDMPNINYYEKNNLRNYEEQKKRQLELTQQYNCISAQIHFEIEIDTESEIKILKWKHSKEQAEAELNKLYQQERDVIIEIQQKETKMLELKDIHTNKKNDLEIVERELTQYKSQIDVFGKLYLESQKTLIIVQKKIEQKKIECNTVLKDCKIENFIIPMSETSHRRPNESFFTSSSSSNAESLECSKVLTKIDFSQFPRNICNCSEEDLQDMSKELNEKLTKIQSEFTDIVNPNLKVDEKIDSIAQQIQALNTNLRNCRIKCNKIKTQFELIKAKRYKLFSDCLEYVATEINAKYKDLVNDQSAQAIILPDNSEEPYAGKLIYNCIIPFKGFHPMQCLSGGEKSLASLALLFVILRYKRIPFLIMDEADAALDKTNIKNVIRFIQSEINTIQFITISLHKKLYSNANMLIGVTVQHDIKGPRSKVFAISLRGYRSSK